MNILIPIEERGHDFEEVMSNIASQRYWNEYSVGGDVHGLLTFPSGLEGDVLSALMESLNIRSSEYSLIFSLAVIRQAMQECFYVKKFVSAVISGTKIYNYIANGNMQEGDEDNNTGNIIFKQIFGNTTAIIM